TSTGPVRSARRRAAPGAARSSTRTVPPVLRATSSSADLSRPCRRSVAPRSARACDVARPTPDDAPVTRAIAPAIRTRPFCDRDRSTNSRTPVLWLGVAGNRHEALADMFERRPELVFALLGDAAADISADAPVRVASNEFGHYKPTNYYADLVLVFGSPPEE